MGIFKGINNDVDSVYIIKLFLGLKFIIIRDVGDDNFYMWIWALYWKGYYSDNSNYIRKKA